MRASALTLCSYIEGVTGSGATATVRMRPSCSTARLRVGVKPGKRVIMRDSDWTMVLHCARFATKKKAAEAAFQVDACVW